MNSVEAQVHDRELVTRARAGDPEAFGLLAERYRALLCQIIQARVHRPEVAEELAQEVLCRAYRHLHTLQADHLVGHWLARMAANAAAQWLRSQQARRRMESKSWMVPVGEDGLRPDEILEIRETRAQVQEVLGRLSVVDWRVVVLYYMEGRTCREISQVLGVARDTVKGRLWRVRRRLRQELAAAYAL